MNNKLRKEAEEIINRLSALRKPEVTDFDKVIHELQVHQVELELQNDELKRTSEELEISHRRFTDLFEHAPVGYFLIDDKTQILNVNISAASMLGMARSKLISRPITLYIHPGSQDTFYFHIQKVLAHNTRQSTEITFKNATGQHFYAQVQSIKDTDALTETHRIRLAIIDISERKNAELKLKRFRVAIDSSADNIFLIDYDYQNFIDVNESACQNLGYSREELLEISPQEINYEFTQEKMQRLLHESFEQNKNRDFTVESIHQRKDGSVFDVEVFFKCVHIESEKILVAVARDITERNKIKEKLQDYTNELKEINESKDKFLSIISHDLRGPFLGLNGYTQMLIEDYDTLSKDEIMSFLHKIHDSSRDLYTLVDNLLKWSRLELGKIPYDPMSFNLYDEMEPLIKLLTGVAHKKDIILENQLQKEVYPYADRLMLISVMQNLISNAIKFTLKKGKVKIYSYVDNGSIFIQVEDNGVGMPKKVINKLFSIDKEFTSRGTDGEKGTGFGLIIAREMVTKMGGEIWVESEPDKGTKFTFTLSLAQSNDK